MFSLLLPPELQQFFLIQNIEESAQNTILHVEEKHSSFVSGTNAFFRDFFANSRNTRRHCVWETSSLDGAVSPMDILIRDICLTRRIVTLPNGEFSVTVAPT